MGGCGGVGVDHPHAVPAGHAGLAVLLVALAVGVGTFRRFGMRRRSLPAAVSAEADRRLLPRPDAECGDQLRGQVRGWCRTPPPEVASWPAWRDSWQEQQWPTRCSGYTRCRRLDRRNAPDLRNYEQSLFGASHCAFFPRGPRRPPGPPSRTARRSAPTGPHPRPSGVASRLLLFPAGSAGRLPRCGSPCRTCACLVGDEPNFHVCAWVRARVALVGDNPFSPKVRGVGVI